MTIRLTREQLTAFKEASRFDIAHTPRHTGWQYALVVSGGRETTAYPLIIEPEKAEGYAIHAPLADDTAARPKHGLPDDYLERLRGDHEFKNADELREALEERVAEAGLGLARQAEEDLLENLDVDVTVTRKTDLQGDSIAFEVQAHKPLTTTEAVAVLTSWLRKARKARML